MKQWFIKYWNNRSGKTQYMAHVILITALVFGMLYLGTSFKINLKAINPLTKSLTDYEITDIVFSKFRDQSHIDLSQEIIIVNTGRPDRSKILEALKRLDNYNAKAIGIDLVFSTYDDSPLDQDLASQIQSMPNIVLASILGDYNNEEEVFDPVQGCAPEICKGVSTGYINFVAKPQHTIRLFSTNENTTTGNEFAFAVQILEKSFPERTKELLQKDNSLERINYKGNLDSYLFYEIDQLLTDKEGIEDVFRDKIVLMGYAGEGQDELSSRDKFYTPLNDRIAAKSLPDMFGLVIHANIVSMLYAQEFITEMPKWFNRILEILIVMMSVALFRMDFISFQQVYWILIRILQVVMFVFLFYLVAGVFYFFDTRLNLNIGIIGALVAWDVVDLYENIIHPRLKNLIFGPSDNGTLAVIGASSEE